MKRIDPATVPEVFKRRGLKPVIGDWVAIAARGECCVLSALYCDTKGCEDSRECLGAIKDLAYDHNTDEDGLVAFVSAPLEIDTEYAKGVYCGWDNGHAHAHEMSSPERKQGHIDGFEARKACEAAGILEPPPEDEDPGDYSDWLDGDVYDDEEGDDE